MSVSTPYRPAHFRLINGLGSALDKLGIQPAVNADKIFARAQKNTGLSDFGDPWFETPMRILIDSLDKEAGLHTIGRLAAPQQITASMEKRLQLIDWFKQHPEEEQEQITAPIFIVGPPRTGTTILHQLMSQDPANRAPVSWEVDQPIPRPDPANYDNDPRIEAFDQRMAMVNKLAPDFASIHEIGARLAQECLAITLYNGYNVVWLLNYFVPSYVEWYRNADPEPSFHFHKRFLQMFQATHKGDWWLLKSPAHLNAIEAILKVYPDARFVFTHRSPVDIMGSLGSFTWNLTSMFTDSRLDPKAIGEQQVELWHYLLSESMRQRDRLPDQGEKFYDVQFGDLVSQPVDTVKDIYRHFGLPWPETMDKGITDFLAANPQGKYGKHSYALGDYFLEADAVRERFSDYIERFGLG